MTNSAKSLFVFGCYLLGLGMMLVVAPNVLLAIFGIQPPSEVWIRIVGMLLLFLGVYDVLAARINLEPFIAWSVPMRFSVIIFFLAFVLFGFAPTVLLLFGAIDFAFAYWTRRALRREYSGTKAVSSNSTHPAT